MTDREALAALLPCEDPEEPCDQDGRDEHRWCDNCIARAAITRAAGQTLGKVVAAAGGEVRVPDNLMVEDVEVSVESDPLSHTTLYRARRAADALAAKEPKP